MPDPVEALILDLLEWIGPRARPYREVIDAWRTSCPRLPVWEEAHERGFIEHHHAPGAEAMVSVSARGVRFLAEHRRGTFEGDRG
jgi:D-3-phosphoglycerate dehydrogenase